MKIYLAGKVPKGRELDGYHDWRLEYARGLVSLPSLEVLSPEDYQIDESKPIEVFGHDCYLIQLADAVVVNASVKLGVGTAQEMLIAKYFCKPVVTILPRNTHHRRTKLMMHSGLVDDWVHPFISATSDVLVDDVDEAALWLRGFAARRNEVQIKNLSIIDFAIESFRKATHGGELGRS